MDGNVISYDKVVGSQVRQLEAIAPAKLLDVKRDFTCAADFLTPRKHQDCIWSVDLHVNGDRVVGIGGGAEVCHRTPPVGQNNIRRRSLLHGEMTAPGCTKDGD